MKHHHLGRFAGQLCFYMSPQFQRESNGGKVSQWARSFGSTPEPCHESSYVSEERLRSLPKGALRGFPQICPDFVIELRSESDALQDLKDKMSDWIANGAQLGWLIDPYNRQVPIFHTNHATEVVTGNHIAGHGPAEGFVLDLARVWNCYQD